jgi:Fe-S-cluster containining protein
MPQDKNELLIAYRQLLTKLDQKFSEIQSRHLSRMKCGAGCHSCCVPNLTVFEIERENIRELIERTPGLEAKLVALEKQNPHKGTRCRFLDAQGNCAVYEARPLVCRSHGAPLFSKQDGEALLDVCPLNFSELETLSVLLREDFINLDLLNTILAALNKNLDPSGARIPLTVDGVLQKSGPLN